MTIQRRTQQRYEVRIPVEFESEGQDYQAETRNMSLGGMFIETAAPLKYGQKLRVRFRVPVLAEPIEVESEVRWVEKSEGLVRGVGIQFFGLRAKHVWALNKFFATKQPL